jgi:hypothetical protein
MDIFDEHLIAIWEAFTKHNVAYIMVGGFAVNMHGFHRTTEDFDILLLDTLQNRKNFRASLIEAKIGDFEPLERMQFVPGWTTIQINNGMQLDILTSLQGVTDTFEQCLAKASIAEIHHLKIPILHINHLIQNKQSVNRPKDQIDIFELEKIKKLNDKHI